MIPDSYFIQKIPTKLAKEYIHKNHYTHGSHNAPSPCYGLYDGNNLIGVCMFAIPCSERVRSSIFGEEYKNSVIELHRLHILDVTPKNTESWFISRCLKRIKNEKPHIKAVIAFSDPTEGHYGTIYQSTNALYYGMSAVRTFYRDESGRLRHPRQNGKNITVVEAINRGWCPEKRSGKYKYVWILDKRYKKYLKVNIKSYRDMCVGKTLSPS